MTPEKTNWLTDLVGRLGFPIVVCGWLLYERSTMLQQLTEAINNNSQVLQEVLQKIGG